jgi:hypothetical protein
VLDDALVSATAHGTLSAITAVSKANELTTTSAMRSVFINEEAQVPPPINRDTSRRYRIALRSMTG